MVKVGCSVGVAAGCRRRAHPGRIGATGRRCHVCRQGWRQESCRSLRCRHGRRSPGRGRLWPPNCARRWRATVFRCITSRSSLRKTGSISAVEALVRLDPTSRAGQPGGVPCRCRRSRDERPDRHLCVCAASPAMPALSATSRWSSTSSPPSSVTPVSRAHSKPF